MNTMFAFPVTTGRLLQVQGQGSWTLTMEYSVFHETLTLIPRTLKPKRFPYYFSVLKEILPRPPSLSLFLYAPTVVSKLLQYNHRIFYLLLRNPPVPSV